MTKNGLPSLLLARNDTNSRGGRLMPSIPATMSPTSDGDSLVSSTLTAASSSASAVSAALFSSMR